MTKISATAALRALGCGCALCFMTAVALALGLGIPLATRHGDTIVEHRDDPLATRATRGCTPETCIAIVSDAYLRRSVYQYPDLPTEDEVRDQHLGAFFATCNFSKVKVECKVLLPKNLPKLGRVGVQSWPVICEQEPWSPVQLPPSDFTDKYDVFSCARGYKINYFNMSSIYPNACDAANRNCCTTGRMPQAQCAPRPICNVAPSMCLSFCGHDAGANLGWCYETVNQDYWNSSIAHDSL